MSFMQTMKAVAWSFFGVRKSRDLERDVGELNPLHVIVAGIVAAAIFVIDSKLPKDVRTITLSYTFFEVGGKVPAEPSARAAPEPGQVAPS